MPGCQVSVTKAPRSALQNLSHEELAKRRKKGDASLAGQLRKGSIVSVNPPPFPKDPFKNVITLPGPRKHRKPKVERFLDGKSSIYSVAYAIDERHKIQANHKARVAAAKQWSYGDKLEFVKQENKRFREQPSLPKAVNIKLRITRVGAIQLTKYGYQAFRFETIPECICFYKSHGSGSENTYQDNNENAQNNKGMGLHDEVLRSCVRTHFVCFYHSGTLYTFNAKCLDGFEAFELMVRAKYPYLQRGPKLKKPVKKGQLKKRVYKKPEALRASKEPTDFNKTQTHVKIKAGPSFHNTSYLQDSLVPRKQKKAKLSLTEARLKQREKNNRKRLQDKPSEMSNSAPGQDDSRDEKHIFPTVKTVKNTLESEHLNTSIRKPAIRSTAQLDYDDYVTEDLSYNSADEDSVDMSDLAHLKGRTVCDFDEVNHGPVRRTGRRKLPPRPATAHIMPRTPKRNDKEQGNTRAGRNLTALPHKHRQRPSSSIVTQKALERNTFMGRQRPASQGHHLAPFDKHKIPPRPYSATISHASAFSDASDDNPSIFRPNSGIDWSRPNSGKFSVATSSRPSTATSSEVRNQSASRSRPSSAATWSRPNSGKLSLASSSRPSTASSSIDEMDGVPCIAARHQPDSATVSPRPNNGKLSIVTSSRPSTATSSLTEREIAILESKQLRPSSASSWSCTNSGNFLQHLRVRPSTDGSSNSPDRSKLRPGIISRPVRASLSDSLSRPSSAISSSNFINDGKGSTVKIDFKFNEIIWQRKSIMVKDDVCDDEDNLPTKVKVDLLLVHKMKSQPAQKLPVVLAPHRRWKDKKKKTLIHVYETKQWAREKEEAMTDNIMAEIKAEEQAQDRQRPRQEAEIHTGSRRMKWVHRMKKRFFRRRS